MGVLLAYVMILGIAVWFAWGTFAAARRAFTANEITFFGVVVRRWPWASAIGVVFSLFGLGSALVVLGLLVAVFTS